VTDARIFREVTSIFIDQSPLGQLESWPFFCPLNPCTAGQIIPPNRHKLEKNDFSVDS
jgi:hypothetical protein